jgi:hypothetical protein
MSTNLSSYPQDSLPTEKRSKREMSHLGRYALEECEICPDGHATGMIPCEQVKECIAACTHWRSVDYWANQENKKRVTHTIAASDKSVTSPIASQTTAVTPQLEQKTFFEILASFPQELKEQLVFTETTACHTIKVKNFLGSDTFAKIAAIIKELGGSYISAGKDSRFIIQKISSDSTEPSNVKPHTDGVAALHDDGIWWRTSTTEKGDPCKKAYLNDQNRENVADGTPKYNDLLHRLTNLKDAGKWTIIDNNYYWITPIYIGKKPCNNKFKEV